MGRATRHTFVSRSIYYFSFVTHAKQRAQLKIAMQVEFDTISLLNINFKTFMYTKLCSQVVICLPHNQLVLLAICGQKYPQLTA